MRTSKWFAAGFGMLCLVQLLINNGKSSAMEIKEVTLEGEKVVLMENKFYSSILIPEKAMLPLTYKFKSTGNDVFIRRENLKKSFRHYDGLVDCLPWVGESDRKFPVKGLLIGAKWDVSLKKEGNLVKFIGKTKIEYEDVLTSRKSKLLFKKTMIGSEDTSQIRMNYEIENIGKERASFIFAAHARVAAGGSYTKGDYFFTPKNKCWIGDMKWDELEKRGIKPNSWGTWPIKGIEEHKPKLKKDKKGEYIYVYIPTYWSAVGDANTKELIVFWNSPLRIDGKEQPMYTCYLKRDSGYLVEISGSRALTYYGSKDKGEWARVTLPPKKKCEFSICMSVYKDMMRSDISAAKDVYPDYVVMEEPAWKFKNGKIRFSGKIRASGILRFKLFGTSHGNKEVVLFSKKAGPGLIDLNNWKTAIHKKVPESIELIITDAFGKT